MWLLLIAGLHYWLNGSHDTRQLVRMGYMPVITNLACPLLDHASRNGKVRFEAVKFASFAEMAEALRHDQIQAAFIIAPLSIVLRQQGEDVKIVYIGNRHESTLVTRKTLNISRLQDLRGKTLAVPMRFSGHNLSLLSLMNRHGLKGQIKVVEMNPPDMASALASGILDGYYVGEPFAAQTIMSGDADVLHYVEDVWPGFICNLMVVKQAFIDRRPELVQQLVTASVRSGIWAQRNGSQAARIVSRYWNQPADLIEYALTNPAQRIVYNAYQPEEREIQRIADMMVRFRLIDSNDISNLVQDHFARNVPAEPVNDLAAIFEDASTVSNTRYRAGKPELRNKGSKPD
jgi:NitT/TauT family transport system substrate-binding protein